MKQFTARFLTILSIHVLLFAGMAAAQSTGRINVSIPFSFSVEQKTFPAGNYQVKSLDQYRIVLDDAQSHNLALVMTHKVECASDARDAMLEFVKSGDQYILVRIWSENNSIGYELPQAKLIRTWSKGELARATIRIRVTP